MKKLLLFLFTLGLTVGLVPPPPARASFAAGNVNCSALSTGCATYRGVMATVWVADYELSDYGVSISSVYVFTGQSSFVEVGYQKSRIGSSNSFNKKIFVKAIYGGTIYNCPLGSGFEDTSFAENVALNGEYRFMIYQVYPYAKFWFKYWRPDGSERVIPCQYDQPSMTSGKGLTSTEIANQFYTMDEPGLEHTNIWVQRYAGFGWYPANATYNGRMQEFQPNQLDFWHATIVPNSGLAGDDIYYSH